MPKGVAVVIINSNFKRTLVGSEYNTRREQCETGARFFQQPALRDVTLQEFNAVAHELDPVVAKRVRHVLTENAHRRSRRGAGKRRPAADGRTDGGISRLHAR
jgi:galactokinase